MLYLGALPLRQIMWLAGFMAQSSKHAVFPTNGEVAKALGMSVSGASRLRSGARQPSIDMMARIEEVYGWPMSSQITARAAGAQFYAQMFEGAVTGGSNK